MAARYLRLTVGALLFTLSCAAMAENAVTTQPASVRAGPDDSYPEVAQLDADAPIQVMGCLDDWSWCDVTFADNRGWIYSPDITYEYEGGYVPFYTYAPAFSVPVVTFTVDAYWGRYYHNRPWYRERDTWAHRVVQHRPPPGPRPRSGPPPREVIRTDRPHGGPPGDRSIRLGGSAPRQPEHAPPPAQHAPPPHEPSNDEHRDDHRDDHRWPAHAAADRGDHGGSAADRPGDHHPAAEHRGDRAGPGTGAPEHAVPDRPSPPRADAPRPAPPPHAAPEHPAPQRAEAPHHEEPHAPPKPEGPPRR